MEANGSSRLKGQEDDADMELEDKYHLSVHDIDAHWLQRQLSKFYSDANISSKLAEETLDLLQIVDERLCENKLVVLLDFDKFDFIKLLMKNKVKIYYCTKLKQAQTEEEKRAVEEELANDGAVGSQILEQLYAKSSAENWAQVCHHVGDLQCMSGDMLDILIGPSW